MAPEYSRRDRAPGPPRFGQGVKLGSRRARVETFDFARGELKREVARRPSVRPVQTPEQINFGSPGHDDFERDDLGARRIIVQTFERVEIQVALDNRARGELAVERLLPAKADAP